MSRAKVPRYQDGHANATNRLYGSLSDKPKDVMGSLGTL
jgi:hypothetical protein